MPSFFSVCYLVFISFFLLSCSSCPSFRCFGPCFFFLSFSFSFFVLFCFIFVYVRFFLLFFSFFSVIYRV